MQLISRNYYESRHNTYDLIYTFDEMNDIHYAFIHNNYAWIDNLYEMLDIHYAFPNNHYEITDNHYFFHPLEIKRQRVKSIPRYLAFDYFFK